MKFNRFTRIIALVVMAMMLMFVFAGCTTAATTTTAAAGDATTASSGGSMIIMIVLMVVVFYFLLIRPENKKKKQAEEMRNSLSVGDTITTIGGIIGKIVAVKSNSIVFETGEDRVRLEVTKWAISTTGKQTEQDKQ